MKKIEKELLSLVNNCSGVKGIIVRNNTNNDAIKINSEEVFPSASVIKLFILMALDESKYNYKIKIQEDDIVEGFGILKCLSSNIELTIKDLATLMITLSDNTATNILIDYIGMENINNFIYENGVSKKTVLARKMMDSEAKKRGLDNFTTPEDVLIALDILCQDKEKLSILKNQMCNNKLPLYFFRKTEFAHKTGDLPNTEHDVGRIYFKDGAIDVIVLTKSLNENRDGVVLNNLIGELIFNTYHKE